VLLVPMISVTLYTLITLSFEDLRITRRNPQAGPHQARIIKHDTRRRDTQRKSKGCALPRRST
jgi:hypothetical protein